MDVAALALVWVPFGIPATAFWIYVCASVVLIAGLVRISRELPREHGIDKIMPLGRLFYAVPLAVFGSEHFTITPVIAALVPRWMPAPTFWTYLVGAAFLCAALAIATRVHARLAAALVGMTFFIFVSVMDLPAAVVNPHSRFFWALAARELAFSGGALALAIATWGGRFKAVPRFFIGIPSLFYGVENLLHPTNVPVIPLSKLTPQWVPGRIFLSYLVGVVLIVAGLCLIANRKTRLAATGLGLTVLVTILWVYLPIVIAAPTELVALNYFFDTLLFCGAILLLANAQRGTGSAAVTQIRRMS
jgi:uncharacterized membrane protein YphA (DoxX/SURF4 family)